MDRSTQVRNVKVAVAAIVAALLLGVTYWFVGALKLTTRTYPLSVVFENIQGVDQGTPVMMSGVKIGRVEKVSLTQANKAMVDLSISGEVAIPRGSGVRLASSSLLGDRYIEILPGPPDNSPVRPGKVLIGVSPLGIDDLLPQVSSILTRVDQLAVSLQGLVTDRELREGIQSVIGNVNAASAAAVELVRALKAVADENRDEVSAVAKNLASAMKNLEAATATFDEAMGRVNQTVKSVHQQDVKQMVADLASAARNLSEATAKAAELVGDPQLTADVKAAVADLRASLADLKVTMSNAKAASESARNVAQKVETVVGTVKPAPEKKEPLPGPPAGLGGTVDAIYDSDRGEMRVDVNYTARFGGTTFYRAGLYDVGADTRVNLQAGRPEGPAGAFRAGLYQSRLGLGYDWQAAQGLMLQGDLFDHTDPRADVKALFDLGQGKGGWLGFEDIGGRNSAAAGLRFRF